MVVDAAGEIFGDAPNVAARVQALAEPGSVVVTARVQRQVAGLFVAEERGNLRPQGCSGTSDAVPDRPGERWRTPRGQRHLTPLIGRDEEMAMLMRRSERARQGDGQLVLIMGEPGFGKSRLIEEFHARLRDTPHTWAEWSCSQLLQNTALHPIAEWGRLRFGGAEVPSEQRFADLENSLAQVKLDAAENSVCSRRFSTFRCRRNARWLHRPRNFGIGNLRALTPGQAPARGSNRWCWRLKTYIGLIRHRSISCGGIAERGALAPLFVLITARPEFRPSWGMRSHHGTIAVPT